VALPKRPKGCELPLKRELLGLPDQPGWESLQRPAALCLVRDSYADKVCYWLLASTAPQQSARQIYQLFRLRWGIEESFMAHTLRYLCRCVRRASTLPRTKYLVVYWAGYYALLHASQVLAQIFDHWTAWQHRRELLLEALRYCEGQ